jgi:hypothetical protein
MKNKNWCITRLDSTNNKKFIIERENNSSISQWNYYFSFLYDKKSKSQNPISFFYQNKKLIIINQQLVFFLFPFCLQSKPIIIFFFYLFIFLDILYISDKNKEFIECFYLWHIWSVFLWEKFKLHFHRLILIKCT